MSFDNQLTDDQQMALQLLQEECAEVIQAASKTVRFGTENYDPRITATKWTNKEQLELELGQLQYTIAVVARLLGLSDNEIDKSFNKQAEKMFAYHRLSLEEPKDNN